MSGRLQLRGTSLMKSSASSPPPYTSMIATTSTTTSSTKPTTITCAAREADVTSRPYHHPLRLRRDLVRPSPLSLAPPEFEEFRPAERVAKKHRAIRSAPGRVVISLFRKAVNTFDGIELLKRRRLIEESWVLLRVLLEAHVNLVYFLTHEPKDMVHRYLDASMLEKLKHLREVNFYEGSSLAGQFDREEWGKREGVIKARYTSADFVALRKHGFTGLPFEQRAKAVRMAKMYQYCYRIATELLQNCFTKCAHVRSCRDARVFSRLQRPFRQEIRLTAGTPRTTRREPKHASWPARLLSQRVHPRSPYLLRIDAYWSGIREVL